MHDCPIDHSYQEAFIEPLAQGDGACAFFARDPEGDTTVVSCTYNVVDDDWGRALTDQNIVVRARAAVRALTAARHAAGGEGFRPHPA